MACEGKTKGKVLFKDKGIAKEILVPVAPFFVFCVAVGSCGKSGIRTITYNVGNPAAVGNNGSSDSFNSFKDEIIFFKAVPQQSGTYDGNRYDLWGRCPDGEREITHSFSLMSGSITIINNLFVSDDKTGLVVKDAMGKTLFNIKVDKCDFQTSCDDDCPEGSHKCTHNKYPGYCCVPCKDTGDRLKNIANKVGR